MSDIIRAADQTNLLNKIFEALKLYKNHFQISDEHGAFPNSIDEGQKGFFYESILDSLTQSSNDAASIISLMQRFSEFAMEVEVQKQKNHLSINNNPNLSEQEKAQQIELAKIEGTNHFFSFPPTVKEENQCLGGAEARLANARLAVADHTIASEVLIKIINQKAIDLISTKANFDDGETRLIIEDNIQSHTESAIKKIIGFSNSVINDDNYQYVIDNLYHQEVFDYFSEIGKLFDEKLLEESIILYQNEIERFKKDNNMDDFVNLSKNFDEIENKNGLGFNIGDFFDMEEDCLRSKTFDEVLESVKQGQSHLAQRINENDKVYYSQYFTFNIQDGCNLSKIAQLIIGHDSTNDSKKAGLFALHLLSQKYIDFDKDDEIHFVAIMNLLDFDKHFR